MFEVRITAHAEDDILQNFTWWRDNRDADQAAEWYDSIYPAINSLSQMPRRCAFAREQDRDECETFQPRPIPRQ